MEEREERDAEAVEAFSPPATGLCAAAVVVAGAGLSGALTTVRPAGAALVAVTVDVGLACRPGLQMRWCRSQSLCWQNEPQ